MPYFYLTLGVLVLDQAVKLVVQTKLFPLQSVAVYGGWLDWTYVQNSGAAFGLLQSQTLLFIGLTLGLLAVVIWKRRELRNHSGLLQVGLALALGGALGNLVDRVRLGYVVDFIDLHFWPVFNIADIGIVLGAGLVIWGLYRSESGAGAAELEDE